MPQPQNRIAAYIGADDPRGHRSITEFGSNFGAPEYQCGPEFEIRASAPDIGSDPPGKDWEAQFNAAIVKLVGETATVTKLYLANRALEMRLSGLETAFAQSQLGHPCGVMIGTLQPHPIKLKRDIPVLVRFNGDNYVATFVDANLGSSGETLAESVDNLKEIIAITFGQYRSLPAKRLGPGPSRQLAVLMDFLEEPPI